MRYVRVLQATAGVALVVLAAGCSKSPTAPSGGTTPTTTAVAISGTLAVTEGSSSQLKATATRSDASTQDVTQQATWRSSDPAVATISATGLLTPVAPGTADISATYDSQTGRGTTQVSAATYVVTVSTQTVVAVGTCDDVTQGLTSGEFAYRVLAIPTTGSQVTMSETAAYPGNSSAPQGVNLREDTPESIAATRVFSIPGQAGQGVRIQFNATEWDQQIVVIPPSIRWIHDDRMDDRSTSRTHSIANGSVSGTGPNTLSLGNSSCGIRMNYAVSAVRQ